MTPEQKARLEIDALLSQCGWAVQDVAAADLSAARGVALREAAMAAGHGVADYLLLVDGRALGTLEAKAAGATLTSAEPQPAKYGTGGWRRVAGRGTLAAHQGAALPRIRER